MAAKNRIDLKALITAWAATLDLEATHKPDEQEILDSVLLNRDVSNTIAVSGAATDVDFSGYDTIIVNTAQSTALTISNLVDGEFKYLIINKSAANAITFANATDISYDLTYNNTLILLIYKIISKGSAGIIAVPLHKTFDYSAVLTSASLAPGEWQEASLITPWTATSNRGMRAGIWYRTNGNYLDLAISISRTLSGSSSIALLPAGYRPLYVSVFNPVVFGASNLGDIRIDAGGNIEFTSYTTYPTSICLSCSIPLT